MADESHTIEQAYAKVLAEVNTLMGEFAAVKSGAKTQTGAMTYARREDGVPLYNVTVPYGEGVEAVGIAKIGRDGKPQSPIITGLKIPFEDGVQHVSGAGVMYEYNDGHRIFITKNAQGRGVIFSHATNGDFTMVEDPRGTMMVPEAIAKDMKLEGKDVRIFMQHIFSWNLETGQGTYRTNANKLDVGDDGVIRPSDTLGNLKVWRQQNMSATDMIACIQNYTGHLPPAMEKAFEGQSLSCPVVIPGRLEQPILR